MLVLLCYRCCEMAPSQLPAAFIKVTKTKNTISCTTADLVSRYVIYLHVVGTPCLV